MSADSGARLKVRLGLHLRIAGAIAAACIVTIFALGFVLYAASEKMEAALVDQLLGEELNALVQHHRSNPGFLPAAGPNVSYHILRTAADEASLPLFARGLAPGNHEIDIGEGRGDRDVAIRQVGALRYVVIYNIGPYENREREYRELLLYALLAATLFALYLGYALAGVMTRQLSELAERVAALKPDQAHVPLSAAGQDREVATLARALDAYQARLHGMLLREQEFTANASHELRTPLTAIQTSCQMLARDSSLSAKSLERVGFIDQAATQMNEHIQALLLLAREREPADHEAVRLRECAAGVVALLHEEATRKNLQVVLDIGPEVTVRASAQELRLLLGNLLRNAVQYTENGSIRVACDGATLTVSDTGPGIGAGQLPFIFQRNVRGARSDGLGIGLDIVRRVCERAGWTVTVQSTPQQGTEFSIRFC